MRTGSSRIATVASVFLLASLAAADTIIVSPNTISGTIGWNNTNPDVLAILNTMQPMSSFTITVDSTAPAGFESTAHGPAASASQANYSLSAEGDGGAGAVVYTASAQAYYYNGGSAYPFHSQSVTLQPVAAEPNGVQLNFSETVTIHRITFGTDSTCATTVNVKGGSIFTPLENNEFDGGPVAYYFSPNYPELGANQPANSGTLNVQLGSDSFVDTVNLQFPIDVSAAGDTVVDHCIPLPTSGDGSLLGALVTPLSVAGHTVAIANNDYGTAYGPAGNLRFSHIVAGQPLDFPNLAPGAWTPLVNLQLDPGSIETQLVTSADWSNEPYTPIEISAGETTDGSELIGGISYQPFVMTPAYLTGSLRFYDEYAQEHPGAASSLSSLVFGEDYTQDGISVNGTAFGTNIYDTSTDGKTSEYTSSAGRYSPASGELLSTYSMPLLLLYDQPVSWSTKPTAMLYFSSTALSTWHGDYLSVLDYGVPSDSDDTSFRLGTLRLEQDGVETSALLGPGDTATADIHYCFNEVVAQLQSTTGLFVDPTLNISGRYQGADFEGNTVNYDVDATFSGQPYVGQYVDPSVYISSRTSAGSIAFTLPQGTFQLTPLATFVTDLGVQSTGDFADTSLTLGCGQRVTLVPGLTISLDQQAECVPPTAGADIVTLSGTINSNGAAVDRVWYTVNGGGEVDICSNSSCGDTFSVPLALPAGDNSIAVFGSSGFVAGTPEVSETISCNASGCGSGCTSVGPTCTPAIYAPGENSYGMVAFEDLWPINGDLDFNDENVAWNYAFILDSDSKVMGLQASFDMLSLGAELSNGLYIHLPIPAGEAGSAWLTTGSGNPIELMPLTSLGDSDQLGDVVYQLAADTRSLFGNQSGYLDTVAGQPVYTSTPLTLSILFGSSLAQDASGLDIQQAPFDIFIARGGARNHQVHLPRYPGADTGAAAGLFNSGDDRSNLDDRASGGADNTGRYYVNENGLPFGLVIPQLADWPLETTSIENLFPEINQFASSAGASGQTFYQDGVIDSSSWQASLTLAAPIPPQPAAPGAPAFPGVTLCP